MKRQSRKSRDLLLGAIGEPEDLTFIRLYGNIGDELIYAGTRQLLARDDSTRESHRTEWGLGAHGLGRRRRVLVRTLS